MYLCNLARYWLQNPWRWHDSVETCRSVIICEIIVHLLVTVQKEIFNLHLKFRKDRNHDLKGPLTGTFALLCRQNHWSGVSLTSLLSVFWNHLNLHLLRSNTNITGRHQFVYMYIGFKTSFYVVRHLDSIASYLPTGLHLGFFRSWPSLNLPSNFLFRSCSCSLLFRHPLQCYFG